MRVSVSISGITTTIRQDPAPLVQTSLKLQPHHLPPFKSREEYDDWLKHGKDNNYLKEKYWK